MEVLNLFPSCVYVEETKEIDNNTISKIILEKEKKEPSRQLSNRGGWQSEGEIQQDKSCLLYTSPSPRDKRQSRMPSSA